MKIKPPIHCTCTVILIAAVIFVVFYYNSSCIDRVDNYNYNVLIFPLSPTPPPFSPPPPPPLPLSPSPPLPPAHLAPVSPAQWPPTGGVCVLPDSAVAVVWLPGALPGGDSGGSELHRRGSGTPHTHHLFTRCKWESLGRCCCVQFKWRGAWGQGYTHVVYMYMYMDMFLNER